MPRKVSVQAMSEIRDISDILEIAVVLVGTDRLNAVINRDEQVLYRFLSTYRFSRLGHEELQEMTALCEAAIRALQRGQNRIDLPLLRQVVKECSLSIK